MNDAASVADIPDAKLLERAVRYAAKNKRKSSPAWHEVSKVFALGSTYSAQLLRRFGLDPESGRVKES